MFSRAIVGWKVSTRMNTDMVLDALEQALHDRGMPKNVIHHSDRGVQYLSIRHTNRLEAANLRASVGTTGDSYDNALAETVNGLYKTEVIEYLKADWQGLADVQLATLNDGYNEWKDIAHLCRNDESHSLACLDRAMLAQVHRVPYLCSSV